MRESQGVPSRRGPIEAAALAELFARLAHDLRSPLGVLSMAITELRAHFAAELTDEDHLLTSLADRGLLRIGRLADTMSLVAALESPEFQLRRRPIDLIAMIRAAGASALALEPRREVTFASDLPEAPCIATVDGTRLTAAVTELVINAIRHARTRARLRLELAPGEVRIVIEDDGHGVEPERVATLFLRLVRHPSRSGLGIGLSIAHDVIIAHGGSIALEASTLPPGRPGTVGARFVVTLPLGDA